MAHNLTNLQVNKIRLQNSTAPNLNMLLIFTLIFILQKMTMLSHFLIISEDIFTA